MADAMEVLPWVFAAFFTGVFLTLFLLQQPLAAPLATSGRAATVSILRDEYGRIVGLTGA